MKDKPELQEILDFLKSEKDRIEKKGFVPTVDMVINDLEEYLSVQDEPEDEDPYNEITVENGMAAIAGNSEPYWPSQSEVDGSRRI